MNIDKMIAKLDEFRSKKGKFGTLTWADIRKILEAGRTDDALNNHIDATFVKLVFDRLDRLELRIEQKDGERLFDNEVIMAKVSRLEERMEHHFIVDGNWKEAAHLRFTKLEKKHEPVFIIEPDCTCHNDIWTCKRHPEKNKGYNPPVPPSECEHEWSSDVHTSCHKCGFKVFSPIESTNVTPSDEPTISISRSIVEHFVKTYKSLGIGSTTNRMFEECRRAIGK